MFSLINVFPNKILSTFILLTMIEEKTEKYAYDDILEQLGGYSYFSQNVVKYVYHFVNNELDIAEKYKELIDEENRELEHSFKKMKSIVEDLSEVPLQNDDLKSDDNI